MRINWDNEKNERLVKERGVSFNDVLNCILQNKIIDIVKHPNEKKYPNQFLMIVELNNYIHIIPFIFEKGDIFLKTIIPSRKYEKKYKGK